MQEMAPMENAGPWAPFGQPGGVVKTRMVS